MNEALPFEQLHQVTRNENELNDRALVKKAHSVSYHSSCDKEPPDGWKKGGFSTKKSVLEEAYSDAVKLAKVSENIAVGQSCVSHPIIFVFFAHAS
jgi:hypothetical protein